MKQTEFSYDSLFDPVIARSIAERAARWNLPRRTCRPLDRRSGCAPSAELAAFDAEVDIATDEETALLAAQCDERDEQVCASVPRDAEYANPEDSEDSDDRDDL